MAATTRYAVVATLPNGEVITLAEVSTPEEARELGNSIWLGTTPVVEVA